jgi:GAF domain-containing protein
MLDGIEIKADAFAPCAMAAYFDKHIVDHDLAQMPQSPFIELALRHNIKAAWSQPIHDSAKQVVGVFSIYYLKAHTPFDLEEELVNQTVPLMGVAISQTLRQEPV